MKLFESIVEKFRSDVIRGPVNNVDTENKIIKGYSVISIGELKGHGLESDLKTLEQVVELGNGHTKGIKTRFGHPNMSQPAVGTYLGRTKNFRLDGDRVRADLELSEVANISPKGDLATYVLSMAVNDPDMFGASIVVKADREFRIDEDGTKLKDDNGEELLPLLRVKELLGSDVVDEPATGDELFSFFSNSVKPSAEITAFMDEFLKQEDSEEKILSFMNRYITNKEQRKLIIKKLSGEVKIMAGEDKTKKNKFELDVEEQKLKEAHDKEMNEAVMAAKHDAVLDEQERIREINASCEKLNVDKAFAQDLIDKNVSLDKARPLIIDKGSENLSTVNTLAKVKIDGADKFREGASNALMLMGGLDLDEKSKDNVAKSQFNGMTIQKLAMKCLENDGLLDPYMLNSVALWNELSKRSYFSGGISQGSGDFINVLSNTLNKSAGKGWELALGTYQKVVGTGVLKDFKRADIVKLTEIGDVQKVLEGQAPRESRMSDLKEFAQLETWGSKFILSRHVFINDDLNMFVKLPAAKMRALKRKMNKLFYQLVYDGQGVNSAFQGPTMNEDSAVCFNDTAITTAGGHDNLVIAASGAAPSQSTINTAYQAFSKKRAPKPDADSDPILLNIRP